MQKVNSMKLKKIWKKSKIRPRLERLEKDRNISKCLKMSRNVSKCLEIKVQIKKGDKSPYRKGEKKVQIEYGK